MKYLVSMRSEATEEIEVEAANEEEAEEKAFEETTLEDPVVEGIWEQ